MTSSSAQPKNSCLRRKIPLILRRAPIAFPVCTSLVASFLAYGAVLYKAKAPTSSSDLGHRSHPAASSAPTCIEIVTVTQGVELVVKVLYSRGKEKGRRILLTSNLARCKTDHADCRRVSYNVIAKPSNTELLPPGKSTRRWSTQREDAQSTHRRLSLSAPFLCHSPCISSQ